MQNILVTMKFMLVHSCISFSQVVVGNTQGSMALLDLRGKGMANHCHIDIVSAVLLITIAAISQL